MGTRTQLLTVATSNLHQRQHLISKIVSIKLVYCRLISRVCVIIEVNVNYLTPVPWLLSPIRYFTHSLC